MLRKSNLNARHRRYANIGLSPHLAPAARPEGVVVIPEGQGSPSKHNSRLASELRECAGPALSLIGASPSFGSSRASEGLRGAGPALARTGASPSFAS